MRWFEVQKGDVLHWEGDDAHSYVVIEDVKAQRNFVVVPVLDLDGGETYYDHYKVPNDVIEFPWRLERSNAR